MRESTHHLANVTTRPPAAPPRRPAVLFGDQYVWLVLVSGLDAMLTWLILELGGREVNPIAETLLSLGGFPAMVAFKFAMITLFVLICEHIGRRRRDTGRQLAWVAVGIGVLPVAVALSQLVVAYG
ncbi:MAG: DUF5658 family protein [Phycisphaeraceae bacterium]